MEKKSIKLLIVSNSPMEETESIITLLSFKYNIKQVQYLKPNTLASITRRGVQSSDYIVMYDKQISDLTYYIDFYDEGMSSIVENYTDFNVRMGTYNKLFNLVKDLHKPLFIFGAAIVNYSIWLNNTILISEETKPAILNTPFGDISYTPSVPVFIGTDKIAPVLVNKYLTQHNYYYINDNESKFDAKEITIEGAIYREVPSTWTSREGVLLFNYEIPSEKNELLLNLTLELL